MNIISFNICQHTHIVGFIFRNNNNTHTHMRNTHEHGMCVWRQYLCINGLNRLTFLMVNMLLYNAYDILFNRWTFMVYLWMDRKQHILFHQNFYFATFLLSNFVLFNFLCAQQTFNAQQSIDYVLLLLFQSKSLTLYWREHEAGN